MALTFETDTHTYRIDGEVVPSVTEIVAPIQEASFAAIPQDVLAQAAERGTRVHELCEARDYGGDYDDLLTDDLQPFLDAYEQFLADCEPDWTAIESPVAMTDCFVVYAGTLDRCGALYDGDKRVDAILDIKTVQAPSLESKIALCAQTYLYKLAAEKKYALSDNLRRYGLYLKKDGTYKLFSCNDFEDKEGLDVSKLGYNLLSAYCAKQEALALVKAIKARHKRKIKEKEVTK